jgi:hypothetical protein
LRSKELQFLKIDAPKGALIFGDLNYYLKSLKIREDISKDRI